MYKLWVLLVIKRPLNGDCIRTLIENISALDLQENFHHVEDLRGKAGSVTPRDRGDAI